MIKLEKNDELKRTIELSPINYRRKEMYIDFFKYYLLIDAFLRWVAMYTGIRNGVVSSFIFVVYFYIGVFKGKLKYFRLCFDTECNFIGKRIAFWYHTFRDF